MTQTQSRDGSPQPPKPEVRQREKCSSCRQRKKKCLPVDRDWSQSQRCEECQKTDRPCGPNERAPTSSSKSTASARTAPTTYSTSSTISDPGPGSSLRFRRELQYLKPSLDTARTGVSLSTNLLPQPVFSFASPVEPAPASVSYQGGLRADPSLLSLDPRIRLSAKSRILSSVDPRLLSSVDPWNPLSADLRLPSSVDPRLALYTPEGKADEDDLQISDFPPSLYGPAAEFEDPAQLWFDTPLQSPEDIRIVKLEPIDLSSSSDELRATMELWQGQDFVAVSGVWDDGGPAEHIYFTTSQGTKNFGIQQCYSKVLRLIQLPLEPVYIWAPALCINPLDQQEQASQVVRLANVFSNATEVYCWIGEESRTTRKAFEFINHVTDLDQIDILINDNRYTQYWLAFAELASRPWFASRWHLHDLALARHVQLLCGRHTTTWTAFSGALALLGARSQDIAKLLQVSGKTDCFIGHVEILPAYQLAVLSQTLFRRASDGTVIEYLLTLEEIVSRMACFEASEPRASDMIYSVVCLARDTNVRATVRTQEQDVPELQAEEDAEERASLRTRPDRVVIRSSGQTAVPKFPIDYEKSYRDVCQDFVAAAIASSRSLDIVCRPWADVRNPSLPSWISTRSEAPFAQTMDGVYKRVYKRVSADDLVGPPGATRYHASGPLGPMPNWRVTSGPSAQLTVRGFIIDKIYLNTSPAQEGIVPAQWLQVAGWEDVLEPPPEAFWRTLVADRSDHGTAPTYWALACQKAFSLTARGAALNTQTLLTIDGASRLDTITAEYLRRVVAVIFMRRLIATKRLLSLGLAPASAKEQDLICVLEGCSVPVVFRKVESEGVEEDEPVSYTVIGECYVHGAMNGEAVWPFLEEGRQMETFVLV